MHFRSVAHFLSGSHYLAVGISYITAQGMIFCIPNKWCFLICLQFFVEKFLPTTPCRFKWSQTAAGVLAVGLPIVKLQCFEFVTKVYIGKVFLFKKKNHWRHFIKLKSYFYLYSHKAISVLMHSDSISVKAKHLLGPFGGNFAFSVIHNQFYLTWILS